MKTVPRNSPAHPLHNPNLPMTDAQVQAVQKANVDRIKGIRVMSAAKADSLAKAFSQLQSNNQELSKRAMALLQQNKHMHATLTVARNMLLIADRIADRQHLTQADLLELHGHQRFLPPIEVLDQMLQFYSND